MQTLSQLNPCPFCGSQAIIFELPMEEDYSHLTCARCQARGPLAVWGSETEAASQWNSRPANPLVAKVEELVWPLKKRLFNVLACGGLVILAVCTAAMVVVVALLSWAFLLVCTVGTLCRLKTWRTLGLFLLRLRSRKNSP